MQKGKIIKDRIGSFLVPMGFQLTVNRKGAMTAWSYERKEGDIRIRFECQDEHLNGRGDIQAEFYSNIYRMTSENFFFIMYGKETGKFFWSYENEEGWKACIEDIYKGLCTYGADTIKRLSTPTPEFLIEMAGYRQIWGEYSRLISLGNEKWNLEEKKVLEQLECLCKEIKAAAGEKLECVGPTLIIIAAWLGKLWVENCDGKWEWNDHVNTCSVKSCSTGHVLINPLSEVLGALEYGTDRMKNAFERHLQMR